MDILLYCLKQNLITIYVTDFSKTAIHIIEVLVPIPNIPLTITLSLTWQVLCELNFRQNVPFLFLTAVINLIFFSLCD